MKKIITVILLSVVCVLSCVVGFSACSVGDDNSDNSEHTHAFETGYSGYDDEYHWHKATCGHTEISGKEKHTFSTGSDKCSVCQYEKTSPEPEKIYKKVTFNLNGGEGKIDGIQFEVGAVMADLPVPSRDGYRFICWEDFTEEFTSASVMPNRDLSLTAKWEKIISSYTDKFISLKPASEGYKNELIYFEYSDEVDKFVYVEITSDDLGGVSKVGAANNFNLRTLEGMEYRLQSGYTWAWFQGDFDHPNGAQRFTLNYGNNVQLVTVSDEFGVVQQTYLLDIYVRRDYYVKLYKNVFESEPYDTVRVIENDRFPTDTAAFDYNNGFEFDTRVYLNENTGKYTDFVYTTAINSDWDLYQTYKPVTISADADGGTLEGELTVIPYVQYFSLPSPEKDGYDFLGWKGVNGKYLTNIQGYSGVNYISYENNPEELTAVYAKRKQYYTFDSDYLRIYNTVPVVTYTDATMTEILEIVYAPYGEDCVLPVKTVADGGQIFTNWQTYYETDGKFGTSLSDFDFNVKITSPVALSPYSISTNDNINLTLNEKVNCTSNGTYNVYLPADEEYVLEVTTSGRVEFTVNAYGTASASQYVATSENPCTVNLNYYRYELGANVRTHGMVTFNVTSKSGDFNVEVKGATANTEGSPVKTTEENTAAVGEEITLTVDMPGFTFSGEWSKIKGDTTTTGDYTVNGLDTTFVVPATDTVYKTYWLLTNIKGGSLLTGEFDVEGEPGIITELADTYTLGQSVTVTATTKPGYIFIGWYNDRSSELQTENAEFTFEMNEDEKRYIAAWAKVTVESMTENAGTVTTLNGTYTGGEEVTVTATDNGNIGYTWSGWYQEDVLVSEELAYTFNLPSAETGFECYTLTAKWDIDESLENFEFNSGTTWCKINGVKDKSVTEIIVPDFVTSINKGAFSGCGNLESLTLPEAYYEYYSLGKYTYYPVGYFFGTTNYVNAVYAGGYYVPSNLKNLVVTKGLAKNCLNGIDTLQSLTLPALSVRLGELFYSGSNYQNNGQYVPATLKSVTVKTANEITSYAFYGCSNIEDITIIMKGNYYIRDSAFYNCSKLKSITLCGEISHIAGTAFVGCSSLNAIHVDSLATWCNISFDGTYNSNNPLSLTNNFYVNGELLDFSELIIPEDVKNIGDYVFYKCNDIVTVQIPSSVTSISNKAFYDCKNIERINVDAENEHFSSKDGIVYNKEQTEIVCVPQNLTGEITLSDNLTSIKRDAFYYRKNLTGVNLGSGVTSIGDYAFDGCGITDLIIPSQVTSIGGGAFYCSSLKSVIFEVKEGWSSLARIAVYKTQGNISYVDHYEESRLNPTAEDLEDTAYAASLLKKSFTYGGSSEYYNWTRSDSE